MTVDESPPEGKLFQPRINEYSRRIPEDRPNSAIKQWNKFKPKHDLQAAEARKQKEEMELSGCTFQPTIDYKSKRMVRNDTALLPAQYAATCYLLWNAGGFRSFLIRPSGRQTVQRSPEKTGNYKGN